MNLLKLTDQALSQLRDAVVNEARRRAVSAVNGHDAASIIWGNECAKRAVTVAAAGNHSILFVGPANSGKTMLRAICLDLGVAESYEARRCPCGNYDDPRAECRCTVKQIERTVAKYPAADITVEVVRPSERCKTYRGATLAELKQGIACMGHFTGLALDQHSTCLLKAASNELGLDLASQNRAIAVARTIANLDQSEAIQTPHVSEAINYRMFR